LGWSTCAAAREREPGLGLTRRWGVDGRETEAGALVNTVMDSIFGVSICRENT